MDHAIEQVAEMAYYREPLYKINYIKAVTYHGGATDHAHCYHVERRTAILNEGAERDGISDCEIWAPAAQPAVQQST